MATARLPAPDGPPVPCHHLNPTLPSGADRLLVTFKSTALAFAVPLDSALGPSQVPSCPASTPLPRQRPI